MIGTRGAGPISRLCLQPHQVAVADLLERGESDAATRDLDRPGRIAGACERAGQQIAQIHAATFEIGSDLEGPVVVRAGQELAAVCVECSRRTCDDSSVVVGPSSSQRGRAFDVEDA